MLLGALAELLPFSWVTRCSEVGRRLLSEDVLYGQYFIEELELCFGSLAVLLGDALSIVLQTHKHIHSLLEDITEQMDGPSGMHLPP